jgi:hypothetical protein
LAPTSVAGKVPEGASPLDVRQPTGVLKEMVDSVI